MMEANQSSNQNITVFTGVTVIPMDSERLLESHTVLVEGSRIAAVGPDGSVPVPDQAQFIDIRGAFLMPGLANMHAHLVEFDPDPRHLALYLAGGVTTVLSLNSQERVFEWRQKSVGTDLLSPPILMSGPVIVDFPRDYRLLALGLQAVVAIGVALLSAALLVGAFLLLWLLGGQAQASEFILRWAAPWLGLGILAGIVAVWRRLVPLRRLAALFLPQASIVGTPAQARAEVRRQAMAGVDCIKVYDHLNRETYLAALEAAGQAGIFTVGHIPDDPDFVHVKEALDAGLDDVAHVDELTHEFLVGYKPEIQGWVEWEIATDKVEEIVNLVASHNAAVTATLVTNETVLLGLEDIEALLQRPEYARVRTGTIAAWRSTGRMVRWRGQERYRRGTLRPLWMGLIKPLHDAGVPILVGTDSDVEGIVPGFSEHRELELLVEAGLTPFEALTAGTRNPAMIARQMNADSTWGTIEVGNRADLVLLSDNPLEDILNSRRIIGVMARGRWFEKAELENSIAVYRDGR